MKSLLCSISSRFQRINGRFCAQKLYTVRNVLTPRKFVTQCTLQPESNFSQGRIIDSNRIFRKDHLLCQSFVTPCLLCPLPSCTFGLLSTLPGKRLMEISQRNHTNSKELYEEKFPAFCFEIRAPGKCNEKDVIESRLSWTPHYDLKLRGNDCSRFICSGNPLAPRGILTQWKSSSMEACILSCYLHFVAKLS